MQFDDLSSDSGSGEESSGSTSLDRALNHAKAIEKEQAKAKREAEEAEQAKRDAEELKRLQDEAKNITLSPEEQARAEEARRTEHNNRLARDFLAVDDDDDDLPSRNQVTVQKNSIRRDYTEEDAFMAVDTKDNTKQADNGASNQGPPQQLKTLEDYNRFADHYAKEISSIYVAGNNSNQLYVTMFKRLIRGALEPTYPESAKEIVEDLIKYANERIQDKSKKKGKKSTKTHFNQRVDGNEKKRIQNQMMDDDDFM